MATDPPAETSPATQLAQPQAEAQAILARHGAVAAAGPGQGAPAPGLDPQPPGGAAPAEPQLTAGKVTVDWGGTPREVSIEDLVKFAMDVDNARTVHAGAKAELEKLGTLQALANARDTWTPAQQAGFAKALGDPRMFENLGQAPPAAQTPLDDDVLDLDTRPLGTPTAARPTKTEEQMGHLTKAVGLLLQRAEGEDKATAKTDLEDQITGKLSEFSVFKKDQGALQNALSNVRDHMVLNPQADLDQVVAGAARHIQGVIQRHGGNAAVEVQSEAGAHVIPLNLPAGLLDPSNVSALMESNQSAETAAILYNKLTGQ